MNKEAAVEAMLFAMGDSVTAETLAEALLCSTEEIREIIDSLKKKYEQEDRGIQIAELQDAFQLCTKKEYFEYLVKIALHPKKPALTDAMLETLSIIAYKQPVTRIEIDKIRGVKSDHAVNKLIEYELVQELGRLDAPGRPIVFGTTEEFLRCFGVTNIDELPLPSTVQIEDFKAEAEKEIHVDITV